MASDDAPDVPGDAYVYSVATHNECCGGIDGYFDTFMGAVVYAVKEEVKWNRGSVRDHLPEERAETKRRYLALEAQAAAVEESHSILAALELYEEWTTVREDLEFKEDIMWYCAIRRHKVDHGTHVTLDTLMADHVQRVQVEEQRATEFVTRSAVSKGLPQLV